MNALITELFRSHGREIELLNSRPLTISFDDAADAGPNGAATVWLVTAGRAEIFSVAGGDGVGPREHLLSVEEGGLFFGIASADPTDQVIATGVFGTRAVELDIAALRRWAMTSDSHCARAAADAVDAWIERVSLMLARTCGAPQLGVVLKPDQPVSVPADCRAGVASGGVLWMEPPCRAHYVSRAEAPGDALLPLAEGSWVELFPDAGQAGPMPVTCRRTAERLSDERLWRGLTALNGWVTMIKLQDVAFEDTEQYRENLARQESRERARRDAARRLASVMQQDADEQFGSAENRSDDILFQACAAIGKACGMTVRRHADLSPALDLQTNLDLIGKASRFRVRRTVLEGRWWEQDGGPLLAYRRDSKSPVALLPRKQGGYRLYDPRPGTVQDVTRETAASLDMFASCFYRSLPDGEITAGKFIRFAAFGLMREFRLIAAMSVLAGVLGMAAPFFTAKIFDSVIPSSDRPMLWNYVAGLVSAALAVAGFNFVRSITVLRVEGMMDYSGQSSIWSRMLDLPATFFRKHSAGDLADRAMAVDHIRSIVSRVGVTALMSVSVIAFQGLSMATIDMKLTFIGGLLIFIMAALTTLANRAQMKHQRREYDQRGRIASTALQIMSGVGKIRVAGAEAHALLQWSKQFSEQKKVSFIIGGIQNFVSLIKGVFPILCSGVIFLFFAKAKAEGDGKGISTGDFIAFNTAFTAVLASLLQLSTSSLELVEVVPIFRRVLPILTEPEEITDERKHPGTIKGDIEFYHVNFRYHPDGPLILKSVDIKIRKGEFVALVGGSGSGKSTLLRLLLGFEKPESGYVYYDGQDLGSLDLREVRRQLGTVLQTSRLMPTTIYQNIIGASTRLTETDAWEAARMSGFDGDVRNMPMGMHTVVSEGGGAFSGGQKQRLMIARALVNKPRIVLFDEATSALDNRTQQVVTDSLRKLDATRITIAHRLSTVVDADRIVVLEGGEVKEMGTYAELMAKRELFYKLASRQQAESQSEENLATH